MAVLFGTVLTALLLPRHYDGADMLSIVISAGLLLGLTLLFWAITRIWSRIWNSHRRTLHDLEENGDLLYPAVAFVPVSMAGGTVHHRYLFFGPRTTVRGPSEWTRTADRET